MLRLASVTCTATLILLAAKNWATRPDRRPLGNALLSEPEMQSPAIIVGPHRIATSMWLRFVALPQRVPVPAVAHRRWGPPVINVIDRLPPRNDWLHIGATLATPNSGGASAAG
jgi:hypothetical protein